MSKGCTHQGSVDDFILFFYYFNISRQLLQSYQQQGSVMTAQGYVRLIIAACKQHGVAL